MAKTRGTGLLVLWADIDAEHEAEYDRFYREEHLRGLLDNVPGFLSGARYRARQGGPKYLVIYELEDHNVLRSAAFVDGPRYRPSPWRLRASGGHIGRNYLIAGYRQVFPTHTNPVELTGPRSPYVVTARYEVASAVREEVDDWLDLAAIPDLAALRGVLTVRRYLAVEARPEHLLLADLDDPAVVEAGAWAEALARNPWSRRTRPHLRHDAGSPGLYERID